jgi:mono/diheme cytochrome c family protein
MKIAKLNKWLGAAGFVCLSVCFFPAHAQQVASELPALHKSVLAADQMPKGQRLFMQRCAICHGSESYDPATRMLERKMGPGHGSLLVQHLTPEAVKSVVRNGMLEMFPFRVVDLSDEDLDAIAHYVAGGAGK